LASTATAPFVALTAESFTLPEGTILHPRVLEVFNDQALTPQQRAQEMVNLHATLTREASEGASRSREEEQQAWQQEIQTDPVYGNANYEATLGHVGRVMDKFATPEVREAFDRTGAGNNPAVVRFLTEIGKTLVEAGPTPTPLPGSSGAKSTAQLMYGNGDKAA